MPDDNSDSSRSWFDRITQLFASEPESREELQSLLGSLRGRDVVDDDTLGIIEGALEVSNLKVRDIMVPRSQMKTLQQDMQPRDFLPLIIECAHSRFPVFGEDPDEVVGILLAKDMLPLILEPERMENFAIKNHVREAFIIPESKGLDSLLHDFRISRNHMAIIVNEYGGIAGLITIEDVLEQIVGDIEDETDLEEDDYLLGETESNEITAKAIMPIDDFNRQFNTNFADDEFDTIGGLVMQQFGRLPETNESVVIGPYLFTVLSADGRTIRLLKVSPLDSLPDGQTFTSAEE